VASPVNPGGLGTSPQVPRPRTRKRMRQVQHAAKLSIPLGTLVDGLSSSPVVYILRAEIKTLGDVPYELSRSWQVEHPPAKSSWSSWHRNSTRPTLRNPGRFVVQQPASPLRVCGKRDLLGTEYLEPARFPLSGCGYPSVESVELKFSRALTTPT